MARTVRVPRLCECEFGYRSSRDKSRADLSVFVFVVGRIIVYGNARVVSLSYGILRDDHDDSFTLT